jgi:hypothetical protein
MDRTALTGNISPTAAASQSLVSLPPEVTENIARHLMDARLIWGLEDFCALRLTCKDFYIKTFRLFGVTFFSMVTVIFTVASLRRLREIAKHTNTFGLSLSTFPRDIYCSRCRLPTGDAVKGVLMPRTDCTISAETDAMIEAITLAYKIGIEQAVIPGPYNQRIQGIVRDYRKAVVEQRSIEADSYDVNSLAEILAALPNLESVACMNIESWVEVDWSTFTGIDKLSFLNMDSLVSGKNNLTGVAGRVLQAIGLASVLRRSRGQDFYLKTLGLVGDLENYRDIDRIGCRQHVALHQIDISDYAVSLGDALSRLEVLDLSIDPCEQTGDMAEKSQAVLKALFRSSSIEVLRLDFFDFSESSNYCSTRDLLGMRLATQRCTRLCGLYIKSEDMHRRLEEVVSLVEAQATTLVELDLQDSSHAGADNFRETWRPMLEVASRCTKLSFFKLLVLQGMSDDPENKIDIDVGGEKAVATLLAKLKVSPTVPGKELGWIGASVEEDQE